MKEEKPESRLIFTLIMCLIYGGLAALIIGLIWLLDLAHTMKRRSEVTNPESADLGLWKQKPPFDRSPVAFWRTLGCFFCVPPTNGTPTAKKIRRNSRKIES